MTTYSAEAAPTKPPGPRLAIAVILIVVGTVLGIGGLAVGISKVVHEFTGTIYTAPQTVHRHLSKGTYEVFAGVQSSDNSTPLVGNGIAPSDVIVTSASGERIPTHGVNGSETLGRGSGTYEGDVEFTIPTAGDYDIQVVGSPGGRFIVTNSFGDLAKHAAIWFVLMGLGMLIGFVGVVLLIVGIVRRRRARQPPTYGYGAGVPPGGAPVPGAPAPGWYPDPQLAGTTRWWDGTRWTDQTHPSA
jgi:hypothetical protein